MKKVKLAIIIIYIIFFTLINSLTIFFIVKVANKGSELYFQQKQPPSIEPPLQESKIEEIIDLLKKLKLL